MSNRLRIALMAVVVTLLASCTTPTVLSEGPSIRTTAIGQVYADAKGMTLYTYDDDASGTSKCNGLCAVFWPPAVAADDARPTGYFTLVTRDNGNKQWAYKGAPLYGYVKDTKPGDITGDGAEGVWHVAKP